MKIMRIGFNNGLGYREIGKIHDVESVEELKELTERKWNKKTIFSIHISTHDIEEEAAEVLFPFIFNSLWITDVSIEVHTLSQKRSMDLLTSMIECSGFIKQLRILFRDAEHVDLKPVADAIVENRYIEKLVIDFNPLDDHKMRNVCDIIENNKTISTFAWGGRKVDGKYGLMLADALTKNTTITTLVITNTRIRKSVFAAVINAISHNDVVKNLFLENNRPKRVGSLALAEYVSKSQSLKHLDLTCCDITDVFMKILGRGLCQNTSIEILRLLANPFHSGLSSVNAKVLDVSAFDESIKGIPLGPHLEVLDISRRFIDNEEEAAKFVEAMNSSISLKQLIMNDVRMSHESAKIVVSSLGKNTSLTCCRIVLDDHLDLLPEVCEMLRCNSSIKKLSVGRMRVEKPMNIKECHDIVSHNTTLEWCPQISSWAEDIMQRNKHNKAQKETTLLGASSHVLEHQEPCCSSSSKRLRVQ